MDSPGNINVVRSYGDGGVRVGDITLRRCCVLTARALITDWPPERVEDIGAQHLAAIFALNPEVVLLGCAGVARPAPKALRLDFTARHIGLESMELGAACRTYNVLATEGRRVVAVLFPGKN